MNNTVLTPSAIGKIKFRIPLYQRPYAWEEIQVIQFLEDLYDSCINDNLSKQNYYIGILSVASIDDDPEVFDLIDGQQRITTLMLIGKVARQYHNAWADFLSDRLDLYGRDDDKKYLNDDVKDKCNPKMLATAELVEKFFNNKSVTAQKEFSKYIYEHAAFFLSKLPSSYSLLDKNQQFVRMNNRGKQLEKHEILKVQLLSQIDDKDEKYTNIWNNMLLALTGISGEARTTNDNSLGYVLENNIESAEKSTDLHAEVFYSAIVTVPEFLLIALSRCNFDHIYPYLSFNTDKLLEIFAPMTENLEEIKMFFEVLKSQTEILRKFFIFRSRNLKAVYELGIEEKDYLTGDRHEWLKILQSFLYVSTEPHHWLIDAFEYCDGKNCLSTDEFIIKLESIDDTLNKNGKRNLTSIDDVNSMTYINNISRYWFYRLDYELWKLYNKVSGNKYEDSIWASLSKDVRPLINEFTFRSSGSVEHIKPQHPIGMERMIVDPDHSFGNLALISSSCNSRFNNSTPDGKKGIIINLKYIESLKMAHFLWGNNGGTSFEQDTEKHCNLMYNILRETLAPKPQKIE